ncbi:hypothetical protein CRG98_044574, partial [Punica granatum]
VCDPGACSSQLCLKLPVVRDFCAGINKLATEPISLLPNGPYLGVHGRLDGTFGFGGEGGCSAGSRGGMGSLRRCQSPCIESSHVCRCGGEYSFVVGGVFGEVQALYDASVPLAANLLDL